MAPSGDLFELTRRYHRPHAQAYGCATLAAWVIMFAAGQWWLFWPWIAWSLLYGVHFLVVRSLSVSSDWVAERVAHTADKAYDLDHIEAIRESYESGLARRGRSQGQGEGQDAAPDRRRPERERP